MYHIYAGVYIKYKFIYKNFESYRLRQLYFLGIIRTIADWDLCLFVPGIWQSGLSKFHSIFHTGNFHVLLLLIRIIWINCRLSSRKTLCHLYDRKVSTDRSCHKERICNLLEIPLIKPFKSYSLNSVKLQDECVKNFRTKRNVLSKIPVKPESHISKHSRDKSLSNRPNLEDKFNNLLQKEHSCNKKYRCEIWKPKLKILLTKQTISSLRISNYHWLVLWITNIFHWT
jgi:hypothetical protein